MGWIPGAGSGGLERQRSAMNSFGRLLRVSIFGESHGCAVGVLLDGVPAGLPLEGADFTFDLERRRGGARPGTTARREEDRVLLESGIHQGRTTGAPLLLRIPNATQDPAAYEALAATPRPGHADLVARQKFGGFSDLRGGGAFSGRLSAGLVAAGVIAKKLMAPARVLAHLKTVGGRTDIDVAVAEAMAAGDSLGGLVECRADGLPAGLGEPFFDSVESLLAHGIFSIPAVKAVEFGEGWAAAEARGSTFHDAIEDATGRTPTNRCGGVLGGITNGNELTLRVAVKPAASIPLPQRTVDLRTGAPCTLSVGGRHDACIALRIPPVLEAVVALVLADLLLLEQRIPRVWSPRPA